MAVQYAPLFALETQFQAKNGRNLTGGFLRVFYAATDDPADTYSDYNLTRNPDKIVLDDNGRALVICDKSKAYRLEVYDAEGMLLWTEEPVYCSGTGGGGVSITKVISTDGSISVEENVAGSTTTYDIGMAPGDSDEFLEWCKCVDSDVGDGNLYPQFVDGTMESAGGQGLHVGKDKFYHITCSFKVTPTGEGINYETLVSKLMFNDGEDHQVTVRGFDIDNSVHDPVLCEFSYDFKAPEDGYLFLDIDGASPFSMVDCELQVHRIYSGINAVPDTCATKQWVSANYQPLSGMSSYVNYSAIGGNVDGQVTGINGSSIGATVDTASLTSAFVSNSAFTSYSSNVENILINMENNVSDISSTVSGLTGTYLEQSASALFAPSSLATSKLDATASSMFITSLPADMATTGDIASAVSGKLDTSAFSGVSGNFVQSSAFTSYTASALTAIDNSISSIQSSMISMSSDVSGKVDQSSMSAWIPYSALDYSGTAISGIGGSSLAGMGGGGADYTGIYPIVVDNTAREIAVDSLPLITDSTMTSYASGDSSVVGVAPGVFFSSLPVSASAGTDSAVYGIKSAKLRSQYDGVDVMPNEVRLWHNGFSASVDYSVIKKWDDVASTVSANSASWTGVDSATVSAIASGYVIGKQDVSGMSAYAFESSNSAKLDKTAQVVTATAAQLYAGTVYLTSVNGAPVSASRAGQAANASLATSAGNAANASLANSAYYDGTGRLISLLPDSATVSAIASAYATGKVDKSSISAQSANWNSVYNTVNTNSASWTGGGGGGTYTSPSGTIVISGSTLEGTNSAALTGASGGYNSALSIATFPNVTLSISPAQLTYGALDSTSTGGEFILDFDETTHGGTLFISGRDSAWNTASASAEFGTGTWTASVPQGTIINQIYGWTDGTWMHLVGLTASAAPQVYTTGVGRLAWQSSVSSKLDTTAFSTVSGTFLTDVPAGYATTAYVNSSVSSKLDTSAFSAASGNFLTAVPAGYATETYVDSSVSSKQDSSAMSAYVPFSAISADENSAITSINGSSIGGGGGGTGGGVDSATVSAIASSYAESAASGKLDTSAFNSGDFYSTANPSGFITGVDLTPYQEKSAMSAYQPSGNYYSANNPNGFISSLGPITNAELVTALPASAIAWTLYLIPE